MNGSLLRRGVRKLLGESTGSAFLDNFTTYDYLYKAAVAFNRRAHFQTNKYTASVAVNATAFPLPPDYLGISVLSPDNRPFIAFTPAGGSQSFIYPQDKSVAIMQNAAQSSTLPSGYYIDDAPVAATISSTATATNAQANGESVLTDSTAPFANVNVGDKVNDITDGSFGYVVAVTSSSSIVCALTDGSNNYFTNGDSYQIVPQTTYQVNVVPPLASAGTFTVWYVQRPAPVFSDLRAYRFPDEYQDALEAYAAFLYKYSDRAPQYGDALFKVYNMAVEGILAEMRRSLPQRNNLRVNTLKGRVRSYPMGQGGHRG